MYKMIFYVPQENAEEVKKAIFKTGSGSIGNYSNCSWETLGVGQFLPMDGARPSLGKIGALERVPELRVEVLCEEKNIRLAIEALRLTHPYEEPAFEVISLEKF